MPDTEALGTHPDEGRALTERGRRQADGLRDQLEELGITRLVASPFVRCVQTLVPLADVLGIVVELDERLAEGTGAAGALALAQELRDTSAVLCSHGDVIPDLLDALVASGHEAQGRTAVAEGLDVGALLGRRSDRQGTVRPASRLTRPQGVVVVVLAAAAARTASISSRRPAVSSSMAGGGSRASRRSSSFAACSIRPPR